MAKLSNKSNHAINIKDEDNVKQSVMSEEDTWVSDVSRWTDHVWVLNGRAPGASSNTVTCIWDFDLGDGSTLFDKQHSQLLNSARHFIWSLIVDRREGRSLKPATLVTTFYALRRLIKWMLRNNYVSFDELDNRASKRYCESLVNVYLSSQLDDRGVPNLSAEDDLLSAYWSATDLKSTDDDGNDADENNSIDQDNSNYADGLTLGSITPQIRVWYYLWQQKDAMLRIGVRGPQEAPFDGRTPHLVAVDLVTKISASIPALPDAVAISLMNAAHNYIGTWADDLVKATAELYRVQENIKRINLSDASRTVRIRKFLSEYRFSNPECLSDSGLSPLLAKGDSPIQNLRQLVDDLVDACIIIMQSETGMRLGEISALLAGIDVDTGLPSCVTVRPSKTGMLHLYYLKSKLSKLRPIPVDEEWLLGAAPLGSGGLPDAVKAVAVLHDLLAPIRAMAVPEVAQFLVVTFGHPTGFPLKGESVSGPNNVVLRNGQKGFASRHVAWNEIEKTEDTKPYIESKGDCIRTHQWRKNYAQFVFQVDKRLLPALARQFKHLSLAMTEGAYVGTNISLVQGVADFNRNLTADLFLSNIRGKHSKQEGRLARLMEEYQSELAKIIEGLDDAQAREAILAWCDSRDMKLFFHGYGKCIPAVAPTKAECHKRANTVHWANKEPNYAKREPSICTGCYLFMADKDNVTYWTDRYSNNMKIWMEAELRGEGNRYRVAKLRAEQSKSYLSKLGAPVPLLENSNAG